MKKLTLILFLSLTFSIGFAQKSNIFHIDSLPKQGILLDKGWKWHAGDNPDFAKADFDDSAWESIDPTQDVMDLPQIQDGKIGWMRIKIKIDSSLIPEPFGLTIIQVLASEIYVDGRLIERFGELNSTQIRGNYTGYPTISSPINLPKTNTDLVIAVRFAFQKSLPYNRFAGGPNYCFNTTVVLSK